MARWTLTSYWNFIREARSEHELSLPESRQLYREVRDLEGAKVFASYLDDHPRISARLADDAREKVAREAEEEAEREEQEVIDELDDWIDLYDEADDYEDIELTGAFDTGKRKK